MKENNIYLVPILSNTLIASSMEASTPALSSMAGGNGEDMGAARGMEAADALVLGPRPFPRGCRHGLR